MAYATVTHVRQLNTGRIFTATSKPTTEEVVSYLEQTAGVIDSILVAEDYALPVPTGATQALKTLEHFNSLGAHAKVEHGAQTSDRRDAAQAMWELAQQMLRDGVIEFPDIPKTAVGLPRSNPPPKPYFDRETEF